MAEEIDLEECNFRQFSEVQKPRNLDLDLGSSQGHINMLSSCRATSVLNLVTVASPNTEIWPFEFREISTFREVWTPVIAFLDGNRKIGPRQAVDQVPCYQCQPLVLSSTRVKLVYVFFSPFSVYLLPVLSFRWIKIIIDLEKCDFRKFRSSITLILTFGSGRGHTDAHMWSRSTHTLNLIEIRKTFCGRTDGQTDRHTWVPIY